MIKRLCGRLAACQMWKDPHWPSYVLPDRLEVVRDDSEAATACIMKVK